MPPEFGLKIIDTLSRRAALRCSNPDCDKLTSGPNIELSKSTNIGEAAHIYGARDGAARFRPLMSDIERAAISNAIWLCRDCHGLIDKDAFRFPSDLLFLWKETHEAKIMREIGKPGDLLRFNLLGKEADEFNNFPPFIRQIIRDRADHWEYILTVELLEHLLAPIIRKAAYLQNGLWDIPVNRVPADQFTTWVSGKLSETTKSVDVLKNLLNELMLSWGAPGVPGDLHRIVRTCELYARCGGRLVDTAEAAMFVSAPEGLDGIARLLGEGAIHVLMRLPEVPKFLRTMLSEPELKGTHEYVLVIDLPDGWEDRMALEFGRAKLALKQRGGRW
jgi:hypothetical protein